MSRLEHILKTAQAIITFPWTFWHMLKNWGQS